MPRARLVELRAPDPGAREVTLYVKGFLGRGERADQFGPWLACHDALAAHGWEAPALGYHWPSGDLRSRRWAVLGAAKGAVDLLRVLRRVRRAARWSHLGWMAAEEVTLVSALFVRQYLAAARRAEELADELAFHLRELARSGRRVRVVAHSLGCRQVIEAAGALAPEERPDEIHLCAPACREDDVAERLSDLARERAFLYFSGKDRVLDLGFAPLARGRALGFRGPRRDYSRLLALDVSEHFDFWVHAEYKRRLAELVPEAYRLARASAGAR